MLNTNCPSFTVLLPPAFFVPFFLLIKSYDRIATYRHQQIIPLHLILKLVFASSLKDHTYCLLSLITSALTLLHYCTLRRLHTCPPLEQAMETNPLQRRSLSSLNKKDHYLAILGRLDPPQGWRDQPAPPPALNRFGSVVFDQHNKTLCSYRNNYLGT